MSNKITIEVFPARDGDSFLISIPNGYNILLDAGYTETYSKWIKPRLQELRSLGQTLGLFIISHIDADHISGAITFLEENGASTNPTIIPIDQIWHNSYRHVRKSIEQQHRELNTFSKSVIDSIIGQPPFVPDGEEEPISASQGSSLGALILAGGYSWNRDFSNKAVAVDSGPSVVHLSPNIRLHILSPSIVELASLEKFWRRELYKLGFREKIDSSDVFDDAFEFLLMREKIPLPADVAVQISEPDFDVAKLLRRPFEEDTSVTNQSSIAFVLESGEKKLLFLGDSHPSIVERSIERLYGRAEKAIGFEFIQLSHHGSFNNNSPELLQMTDSPHYCISTRGEKHGLPDPETLAWIIGRGALSGRTIHFNYRHKMMEKIEDQALRGQYHYTVHAPHGEGPERIEI